MKIGRALLALAVVLTALFAFQRVSDPDAGWLLALGRLVAHGTFPRTNALAWTAPDAPWYPTSWLFYVALYGAHAALGVVGLQLVTFALGAATLALIFLAARRAGASATGAGAAALFAVTLLWPRLVPRPQLVEYALVAFTLWRAAAALADKRAAPVVSLVPALVLWANAHQSAPFGWGLAALALTAPLAGRAGWSVAERKKLAAALGAGLLALAATPGGLANVRDLAAHLSLADEVRLAEYRAPAWPGDAAVFAAAALAVLGAAWTARAWLPATLAFAALPFVLGVRFAGDLAVVGAAPLALLVTRVAAARAKSLAAALGAVLVTFALLAAAGVPVTALGAFVGASWEPSRTPFVAIAEIRRLALGPRGFTAYRFGGACAFELGVDFQDGRPRAWPASFWRELNAAGRDPRAFADYLDRWGATWALTTAFPDGGGGYALLADAPGWRRVYADDAAELYVRE